MDTRAATAPPPNPVPTVRPDTYRWAGPCKSGRCHALRDFLVLTLVSGAMVCAGIGCGVL